MAKNQKHFTLPELTDDQKANSDRLEGMFDNPKLQPMDISRHANALGWTQIDQVCHK